MLLEIAHPDGIRAPKTQHPPAGVRVHRFSIIPLNTLELTLGSARHAQKEHGLLLLQKSHIVL